MGLHIYFYIVLSDMRLCLSPTYNVLTFSCNHVINLDFAQKLEIMIFMVLWPHTLPQLTEIYERENSKLYYSFLQHAKDLANLIPDHN